MKVLSFIHKGKRLQLLDGKEIIDLLLSGLPSSLATRLRSALESTDADLEALAAEVKAGLIDKVDPKFRFLLEPLAGFEDRQVPLLDFARELGGSSKLDLGVSADCGILLDRVTSDEDETLAQLDMAADAVLLKLAFTGKLALAASFTAQLRVLKAGFAINASTEQQLGYSLQLDRHMYAMAVLPRLKQNLCNPLELPDLLQAMAAGDLRRFERSGLTATNVGLSVGLAQELSALLGKSAAASVGASLQLDYRDKSDLTIVVERQADGIHLLELRKQRNTSRSSVLKLGVDIEFSGLGKQLMDRLTQALPEDKGISRALERLDTLTRELSVESLQTTLREQLLEQWPKGKPVFAFLLGEEDSKALAATIRDELQGRIGAELDVRVDLWHDKAEAAGDRVAGQIATVLGLTGDHRNRLTDYISGAVEKALGSFQERIDGKLDKLIQTEDVEKLLEPWSFMGDEVAAALEELSAQTSGGVKKVRGVLHTIHTRYINFRQQAFAILKEDFEERIALSIISRKEREETQSQALRVRFSEGSEALSRLYRAMWNASLDDLPALLAAVQAAPGILELAGEYVDLVTSSKETSLTLSLFGAGFKASDMFSQQLQVSLDINGALTLAKSTAQRRKRRSRRGETQSIEAHWSLDYLDATVLDPPLLLQLSLTDDKFKPGKEMRRFFVALESAGLLRTGVSSDVHTSLFPHGQNKPVSDASMTLNVVWQRSDWLRLAGCTLDGTPVAAPLSATDMCDDYLSQVGTIKPRCLASARAYQSVSKHRELLAFLLHLGRLGPGNARSAVGLSSSLRQDPGEAFHETYRLAIAVAGLHDGLLAMQQEWAALVQLLPDRISRLKPGQAEKLRAAMERVNTGFSKAFGSVVSTGLILSDAGSLHWLTLAALRLFQANSSANNPWLSCTFVSERTGELIFS